MTHDGKPKQGFKCLLCGSTAYVDYMFSSDIAFDNSLANVVRTTDECSCGKLALLLDQDGIIHLYCDDLEQVASVEVQPESTIDKIQGFIQSFVLIDYSKIFNSGLSFTDAPPKSVKDTTKELNKALGANLIKVGRRLKAKKLERKTK